MPNISMSNYDGTINNLTVNGVLTATGGVKMGYYLASASATQVYNQATAAISLVNFPTVILNTLPNLTVTGTNSFQYTGTVPKVWMVNYSCRFQVTAPLTGANVSVGTFIGGFIQINGAGAQYGQQWYNFNSGNTENRGALNGFCCVLMQPNDTMTIGVAGSAGCIANFSENATSRISTLCIIG